jgi:hypothetical protein
MAAPVENAVLQWEDGYARLRAARAEQGARQHALGRVVIVVERELRKRLGSRFSVGELAALYRDQGETLLDRATAAMSSEEEPPLSDASAACDAAFYLYMREASDFGGGRSGPRE